MSKIEGVQLIDFASTFNDFRGTLYKVFTDVQVPNFHLAELLLSKTNKGYVRGMHLQTGQMAGNKIVYCIRGQVFDVLIDLRKNSATYLQVFSIELSSNRLFGLLIPSGVAHGFQAISEKVEIIYLLDKPYSANHDTGVNPINESFEWPLPITGISFRDKNLPNYRDFNGDFFA
jgi:dTDP-4-dehydrorhamnose 3,5-epimerase